jgi:hypothetical protein
MKTAKKDKKLEEARKKADKAFYDLYFSITGKKWENHKLLFTQKK